MMTAHRQNGRTNGPTKWQTSASKVTDGRTAAGRLMQKGTETERKSNGRAEGKAAAAAVGGVDDDDDDDDD